MKLAIFSLYYESKIFSYISSERSTSLDPDSISMCSDFVLDDPGSCTDSHRRYMVVDCGGGTVDITVHEMCDEGGKLKELFKATGGPFGSITVDDAFKVNKNLSYV